MLCTKIDESSGWEYDLIYDEFNTELLGVYELPHFRDIHYNVDNPVQL